MNRGPLARLPVRRTWRAAPARPTGRAAFAILLALACAAPGGRSGGASIPGIVPAEEWITLRDFRHVTSVAVTERLAYFGTTAGLERLDTLRDAWLSPITAADGLPDEAVTALAADPASGDAWVGTPRGLVRVLAVDGHVERAFGPPPARVDVLGIEPDTGVVWARVAGLWWRGRGGPVLERAAGPPPRLAGSTPVDAVDPASLPWLDPLYVESPVARDRVFRLTALDRDLRGDWYVGTWGDNGRRWGAGLQAMEPLWFGLGGPPGGPLARTADGLWFLPSADVAEVPFARLGPGTRVEVGGGTAPTAAAHATADLQTWRYATPVLTPDLPAVTARAAAAVGDTVWLGTAYGLARGVGDAWRAWGAGIDAPLGEVLAIAVDGPLLWLGTDAGLVAWDRAAEAVVARFLRGHTVTAVAVAPDAVYAGTEVGLRAGARVGPEVPASFERSESRAGTVRALAFVGDLLVVASDAGLEALDRATGAWTRIPLVDGRLGGAPLALAADGDRVWIGTDRGLTLWRRSTGTWRTWTPADGLAGTPVHHVLVVDDAVWASTPAGVSRFSWRAAGGAP